MQTVLIANRKGGVGKTMVAVTLASAMAREGHRVAIADADPQQSALDWLARRPVDRPAIRGLSWARGSEIGEHPKKLDWLVIDAPGSLKGSRAEALVAEARAVIAPIQPGVFDAQATDRFLAEIDEIKRVRKGKVAVHVLANRVRKGTKAAAALNTALARMERAPVARIAERAIYGELAEEGLALFDRRSRALAPLQAHWRPVLDLLGL